MNNHKSINVSLRELKLVVGRLLYAAGLPRGCVYPVRDLLVDAQAAGLDAVGALERTFDLMPGDGGVVKYTASQGLLEIDGQSAPSYLVAPGLMDLAAATAHVEGTACLRVRDLAEPALLGGLLPSAFLYGVELSIASGPYAGTTVGRPPGRPLHETGDGVVLVAHAAPARRPDDPNAPAALGSHLQAALRKGFDIDAALWWRLFELSNDALTPDSDLSRRHAGASLLDAGGKIIGEVGEDDDYKDAARLTVEVAQ